MACEKKHFKLQGLDEDHDQHAINVAINAGYRLLKVANIIPKHIIAIGKALYALEKMPESTPDVCIDFGICLKKPNESRYIEFHISEDVFSIFHAVAANSGAGTETYPRCEWRIETGGYRKTKGSYYRLEDDIEAYLAQGAKLDCHDDSYQFE